ncbi:MAG: hypothetical protein M0C28_18390 [Candidatus Moduliflexus flocculans]|nr:hypothetical protein [Candidatus Moduliflexus flocculans]
MIYVFSGTGNSLHAAKVIAARPRRRRHADRRGTRSHEQTSGLPTECRRGARLRLPDPRLGDAPVRRRLHPRDLTIEGETAYVFAVSTWRRGRGRHAHRARETPPQEGTIAGRRVLPSRCPTTM